MKKNKRLTESNLKGIIKKVLSESQNPIKIGNNTIKSFDYQSLYDNFPVADAETIFPGIFPKKYKEDPNMFRNACATRLCLALTNLGVTCDPAFTTERDWTFDGITYPKGKIITTGAKKSLQYLTRTFGTPTIEMPGSDENVKKYLGGHSAIFIQTDVPGWAPRISGHADIIDENGECGWACYFNKGGKVYAWVVGDYKGQNSSGGQQTKTQQTQTQQTQTRQEPLETVTTRARALNYLEMVGAERRKMIDLDSNLLINWANAHIQKKYVFKNGDTYYNTQNASVANDQQAASQLINTVSSQPIRINF